MSDLSNHIFSESSWPPQSTDTQRWKIHPQIHTYTNTQIRSAWKTHHVLYFLKAWGSRISNMTFPCDMVDMVLGPRGPLREPMVPVARRRRLTINHYIIMSDLSNHIFSESSWPPQSTDAQKWQRQWQIHTHKYSHTQIHKFKVLERPIMCYIF